MSRLFIAIITHLAVLLVISANVYADSYSLNTMTLSEFNLPEFDEYSVPVVLTATRLQQHQADVPASVTILDEHFIRQVSAQNFAELLRHVPGMMVGPDNKYNADTVNYHGGPAILPKNLQVLINGRSMYRSGVATVSWYEMPVAIEDIKRIEVVRGPNAASYGANAYQAIINILTKHPADTYGSSVSMQVGNNGEENLYLKNGLHIGKGDLRVSFTQKSTDRFAKELDSKVSRFFDAEHYIQNDQYGELETSFVISDTTRELESSIPYQSNKNDLTEERFELGSRWTKDFSHNHQVKVSGYYIQSKQGQTIELEDVPISILDDDLRALYMLDSDAADAMVNPFVDAVPLVMDSMDELALALALQSKYPDPNTVPLINGYINADLDETRFDIEIQDTYVYSPDLTLVSGASYRRDVVESDMYYNGMRKNNTSRLFASATWQATSQANFHLGLMAEKESEADLVVAPRTALNYKLTPSQSIRLVYSESVRSPDFFEQNAFWQLKIVNQSPDVDLNGNIFYQTQHGPGDLDHQFIKSYELGYYGRFAKHDGELDIRIFQEDLSDVYYQFFDIRNIATIKDITLQYVGVEWQYSFAPWNDAQLRWVGAYVDANTNIDELDPLGSDQVLLKVHAKNTHTFSWLQKWTKQTSSSASFHLIDSYDEFSDDPDMRSKIYRIDGKFIHNIGSPNLNVDLTMNLQHDLLSDPYIWQDTVYESQTRVQLSARVNF